MTERGFVDPDVLARVKVGRDYVAAKYGFRNHWYPVLFSGELLEDSPVPVQICGERLLLSRVDGRAFAIRDQCLHKGVPFSRKLECYAKGTVTCWYHGFTYRFSDGVLCGIVGAPDSNVIGRRKLTTYPTAEAKGLVFVFIGDADVPPPLAEDTPPGFLDPTVAVRGRRTEVAANWRVGCENGFDLTHIFIHKDSILIEAADLALPLGLVTKGAQAARTAEAAGAPKGVAVSLSPAAVTPVFEGRLEGRTVLTGAPNGRHRLPHELSIWLPGALRVHPWPAPHLTQFEWYAPIDGDRHMYFQLLAATCTTDAQETAFDREFQARWLETALIGFNGDDLWAREAAQTFYAHDTAWLREQLFEADANIVEWRRLAATHRRGVQGPAHIR